MICTTKSEAQRVAYFGSRKMEANGGYSYRAMTPNLPLKDRRIYLVTGPEGQTYRISVKSGCCTCRFHEANRHLFRNAEGKYESAMGVCKHLYWLNQQLDEEARLASLLED